MTDYHNDEGKKNPSHKNLQDESGLPQTTPLHKLYRIFALVQGAGVHRLSNDNNPNFINLSYFDE